jgi:predicted phosphodiesterase
MQARLGVIADVHGNALALNAVLQDARKCGIERLVDLGDALYGPMWPLETYDLFRSAPIVAGVAGNQDRKIYESIGSGRVIEFVQSLLGTEPVAWLRALPPTATVDGELFLCHGTPSSDTIYLLEDVSTGLPMVREEDAILDLLGGVAEPVILCGHSHIPRVVRLSNGQLIVNPGSVGLPAYDDDKPVPHFMETYSPHASYAILEKTAGGWHVSVRRVVYDWDLAARQAHEVGADDWAQGLSTGRMRPAHPQRCGITVAGTSAHYVTY